MTDGAGDAENPEHYAEAVTLAEHAPMPARCANVALGTAGWTDKSLLRPGLFYPRGTGTAAARLQFYAANFPMVEVDASYYALLSPETTARWTELTPPSFEFDVKAHPVLTGHPIDPRGLPRDLRAEVEAAGVMPERGRLYPSHLPESLRRELGARFAASIEPLHESGKLGCVMLQFPPWFDATRGNARAIEALGREWQRFPLAVEFRHPSWLQTARRERVLGLLSAIDASYVVVDEPATRGGGVPPVALVTRDALAVVRFHGQNTAGWRRGASVHERFDYLYATDALRPWVSTVRRLADEARGVHVVFNNCVRDYAVLNAKGLGALLMEPGLETT